MARPLGTPLESIRSAYRREVLWASILFAFIFLQKEEKQTIMVAIAKFQGLYGHANMTHIMSALVIAALPVIVIYFVAQRFFREGVTAGAVK